MRRASVAPALAAVIVSLLVSALGASPAQAGFAAERPFLRWIGDDLIRLQSWEATSRAANQPDTIGYTLGKPDSSPTYRNGVGFLSRAGQCDADQQVRSTTTYLVTYETSCLSPTFTKQDGTDPPGSFEQTRVGKGVTGLAATNSQFRGSGSADVVVADGSLKLISAGVVNKPKTGGGSVDLPTMIYDPGTNRACLQVGATCERGATTVVSPNTSRPANASSVWTGVTRAGGEVTTTSIVAAAERWAPGASGQAIDIYARTENKVTWKQTIGSNNAQSAAAKRLCGKSRVVAGDVIGGTSTAKEIVRFGPDCSDNGDASDPRWQYDAVLPHGLEVWTAKTQQGQGEYYGTTPKPWRIPNNPRTGKAVKISDAVLGDVNKDGLEDIVMGFSTGGYAVAVSVPGATDLQPMLSDFELVWGDEDLDTTPINQVAVRELSSARTANPTAGADIALATNDGLIAMESVGTGTFIPFEHLNTFSGGTAIQRSTIAPGRIAQFAFGQYDNDDVDDVVVYDGWQLWMYHGVTKGPTITSFTSSSATATTASTLTLRVAQNASTSAFDVLNEKVDKILVDLDGNGIGGEKGSNKEIEPSATGENLVADGIQWQPTRAGTYTNAKAYVYNRGGEVTVVPLTGSLTVTAAFNIDAFTARQPLGEKFENPWSVAAAVSGGTPPYSYAWTLPSDARNPATAEPENPQTPTNYNPGNVASFSVAWNLRRQLKDVTVKVTDSIGRTTQKTITIQAADPMVASQLLFFPYGLPAQVGDIGYFSEGDTTAIYPYTWSWTLRDPTVANFIDGTPAGSSTSDNGNPSVMARKAGVSSATYVMTDAAGRRYSEQLAMTVVDKLIAGFDLPAAPAPGAPAAFIADGKVSGGAGAYRYAWSVTREDGSSAAADFTAPAADASEPDFSPTFTRPGRYEVTLDVDDQTTAGQRRSPDPSVKTQTVKIAAALAGTIDTSNASPQIGESVTLTAKPTGGIAPYTYRWDTDGGGYDPAAGTAATTTRSYSLAKTYTAKVEITDADGEKTVLTRPVGVSVELAAGFTRSTPQPLPGVAFTASAGATVGGVPPYTYAWSFDGAAVAGQTGATLTRTVAAPGRHRIGLVVTDSTGRTDAAPEQSFKVAAPITGRVAVSDAHPLEGDEVTLDASGTTGGLPPLTYAWDLDGDGTFETTPSTSPTRALTLTGAGARTVGLKVVDDDGVTVSTTSAFTVSPKIAAALTATPDIAAPGQEITFSAAATAGGAGALGYEWDLDGDGSFETDTGATPTAKRAYAVPADFTISVRATDPFGHRATATTRVSVAPPLTAAITATAEVETGDDVAISAAGSQGGVGTRTYAFDTDGDGVFETDAGEKPDFSLKYGTGRTVLVTVRVRDARGQEALAGQLVRIVPRLIAAIDGVSRIATDRKTTYSAAATSGGTAPLTFAFDVDGNGSYELDAGAARTFDTTYTAPGKREVGVRVSDAAGRVREARRSVDVVAGCETRVVLAMGVVQARPGVCLSEDGTETIPKYTANGSVTLNGQPLTVAPGKTISVWPISKAYPGGRISGQAVEVVVNGSKVFGGALDWRLPFGKAGEERVIAGVAPPLPNLRLLGLDVQGRIAVSVGTDSSGTPYLRLGLNMAIPSFRISPDKDASSVTGALNLRIDAAGVHTESALIRAETAYMGAVRVNDICLSYLAKGQSEDGGARCEQFRDFTGETFMECKNDPSTDRWDGTVDVTFPGTGTGIAASGSVSDGSLSSLAMAGDFGRTVPLKPGAVWLEGIAAGVCLTPQLKIKGSAQIGAIAKGAAGEVITADGSFEYNDAYDGKPWSILLRGRVQVMDHEVGRAYFGLDGKATATFGWNSAMAFPSDALPIAKIEGSIDGWVELQRTPRFNVEGRVQACIVTLLCTTGEAVLSSDGVAACVSLFKATIYYPTVWPPSYGSYNVDVRGGFGYKWGGNVSVMAASCDIGPWRATRSSVATRSQATPGARSFEVVEGQPVATIRVGGEGSAPKITLRGPKGEIISSAADQPGAYVEGQHMLYEDAEGRATQAMVFKPSPGVWTVESQAGSTLAGGLQQADYIAPTSVYGKVAGKPGAARRKVDYAYTVQPGTTVRLVELSKAKGLRKTLGTLRAGKCDRPLTGLPKSVKIGCGGLSFTPSVGGGGRRDLVAEVMRGGLTVDTKKIATYKVSAAKRLKAAKGMQVKRVRTRAVATWASVPGAVSYDVVTKTAEAGIVLSSTKKSCRRWTVPSLANGSSATVTVRAIDSLGRPGRAATITIKAKRKTAGAKTAARAGC